MLSLRFLVFAIALYPLASCHQGRDTHPHYENALLQKLMNGNEHFRNTQPTGKIKSLEKRQFPFAVVVSCSDSRVSPELIFDQDLGKLFVVRTAGNVIGDYELGSIEYAVLNFKTPLIIVLGHDNCGAVSASLHHKNDTLHGHINSIVEYIKSEKEEQVLPDTLDTVLLPMAVKANIQHAVTLLRASNDILWKKIKNKELQVVGAVYHLHDGTVEILNQ